MSCFVKVKTRITDVTLLRECLEELGYSVERRPARDQRGDEVVSVTGRGIHFDVAAQDSQAVQLLGDSQDLTRDRVNEIHRRYAEKLILREAARRGFTGIERREVGGEVIVTVRKWVA